MGLTDVAEAIASRVRAARSERGWSLDELAERSGVSRRMLVNVEQGSTNPSVGTLLRISDALGVGLPSLVEVAQSPELQAVRAGSAPALWHGPQGGQGTLVAGTASPDVVELWDWEMHPGERHTSEAHSGGARELMLVLDGSVELTVGAHVEVLSAGDAVAFDGDIPHGYAASGPTVARFALTVFQPVPARGRRR